MLYINPKDRVDISIYRSAIYDYLKKNHLRYSDQRERVLKILYIQSYPVSVEYIAKKLNEEKAGAGYATVSRHLKFFQELEMLTVVNKIPKGYLLKTEVVYDDIEVVQKVL